MSDSVDELPLGEEVEVSPGVYVERRSFLSTVALAFGAAALPGVAMAQPVKPSHEPYSLEDFLREVIPVAKKLVSDASLAGQDRYLHTLAAYAVRLTQVPVPEMKDSGQGAGPGTFIGFHPGGDPFAILHWRMEPGSIIRRHAHTYGNVVTVGLEGEVRVENFEMVGPRDFAAKGTFQVRKTHDQVLTPGAINLVSLERSYVHGFQAGPKGARGLDITTRIREKRPTPYLELSSKPVDAGLGLYEGSWVT